MNGKDLLIGLGDISHKYYMEAQTDVRSADSKLTRGKYVPKNDQPRRKILRRPILIAALIILALLLVSCAVVYVLGLDDLIIAESARIDPAHFDEEGNIIPESESPVSVLSLQGIQGSPEFMASKEWWEYQQSYDNSKAAAEADAAGFVRPEEYEAYFVYNQEMMDKIDEIAKKYDLKLLGPAAVFQSYENHVFFESLRLSALVTQDAQAETDYRSGYFYPCGNFDIDFYQTMTGEGQWPHPMLNSMRYCRKEYLDTVYTVLGASSEYEEMNYTTASGMQVLIVVGETYAVVFCDRADAFITVSMETSFEFSEGKQEYMTKEQLLQVVDSFDFEIRPQETDLALARAELEKFNPELYFEREEARMETFVDPYVYSSYAAFLENYYARETACYALADVNGDGVEELLLGDTAEYNYAEGSFIEVLTIENGETKFFFSTGWPLYLCEGFVIESCDTQKQGENHMYYTLGSDYDPEIMEMDKMETVGFYEIDQSWRHGINSDVLGPETVSEEKAREIIGSYIRIPLDMKPVSEFPKE